MLPCAMRHSGRLATGGAHPVVGTASILAVALALAAWAPTAAAQQPPPPGAARDCQTVRVCNLARHAAVRGCLSSYTCRTCRLVTARCNVGDSRVCQRMVCRWGG